MLSDRFNDVIRLAAELHSSQLRKGTNIPYIFHLLRVTSLVSEHSGNEYKAIAATLHDAVEDRDGKEAFTLIKSKFGSNVADIVWGCSDSYETPKPPWRDRKKNYIQHIAKASASSNCHTNRIDFSRLNSTIHLHIDIVGFSRQTIGFRSDWKTIKYNRTLANFH